MGLKTQSSITEEEARLTKLQEHKSLRLTQINELQHQYSEFSRIYHEKEKDLNMNESQAKNLQEMGGDENKIKVFLQKAGVLENELMELIESQENIQTEIKDHKTFLSGLEKTMAEISSEVSANIGQQTSELAQYKMRMELLFEELPENFRNAIKRVLAKNLAHGPFTKNENGSCYFCRFKISKLDESEIDVQRILKHCPQCSRIFIPYS